MEQWETKYKARDRTTEESHDWLKENYKSYGYKSAAGFLEQIINEYRNALNQNNPHREVRSRTKESLTE